MNVMSSAAERRAARLNWPIKAVRLLTDDEVVLARTTTVEERLAMMWQLALDAWDMSGKALPQYDRDNIPGRLLPPK
jgi:hypothetical protein